MDYVLRAKECVISGIDIHSYDALNTSKVVDDVSALVSASNSVDDFNHEHQLDVDVETALLVLDVMADRIPSELSPKKDYIFVRSIPPKTGMRLSTVDRIIKELGISKGRINGTNKRVVHTSDLERIVQHYYNL